MMFKYQDFDEVFAFDPDCSYQDVTISAVEKNRTELEGLFIERIMKLLGIKRPAKYYPPKSNMDLRNLHKVIVESPGADHLKMSILFYLLLELDMPTGHRSHSLAFERASYLPKKYSIYMKGLHHMDRQDFETALEYLTHPSLIPTFADEILEVLVRSSRKDLTLALAYHHTVQPTLTSRQGTECLFSAIARTSVTEAFYFARGQPEHAHRHMFEMLIALVLNNSPRGDAAAERGVELVNLPLTQQEEAWFDDYLLRGEGKSLKHAKDTLMMRKVGTGRFTEALKLRGTTSGHNNRAIDGLEWATLSKSIQAALGSRIDV